VVRGGERRGLKSRGEREMVAQSSQDGENKVFLRCQRHKLQSTGQEKHWREDREAECARQIGKGE